jgi:hypothetical protein
MGRQLQTVTTPNDTRELLRFVQSLTPIRVFRSHQPTREAIWLDDWEQGELGDGWLQVWLTDFPWVPDYAQTLSRKGNVNPNGLWYIANTHYAPIIDLSPTIGARHGRIYWANEFSYTTGKTYDQAAFGKYVDRLWSWVRRSGGHVPDSGRIQLYYLPEAWQQYQQPRS